MPPTSKSKAVSVRKPLRVVSNNIAADRFTKSAFNSNKPISDSDSDSLDRLLLLHSHISSLLRQVDELVVQAFHLDSKGKQEVESFSHVLSEMLLSLKPWVPRFEKVLAKDQSKVTLVDKGVSLVVGEAKNESIKGKGGSSVVNEIENEAPESPFQSNLDVLISPSPLVSWRANCTTENGKQLFLLTPLPISKGLSTKQRDPPKSVFERVTSEAPRKLFHFNSFSVDTKCNQLQGVEAKAGIVPTEASTPMMISKRKGSIVIMTPCLKRSPPKSCVLLEEINKSSSHGRRCDARRSTPFPVGFKLSDSDELESSSGNEESKVLAFKYPELKGIQQARKSVVTKKLIEESPDWFRSPPKSCVLLEPKNEETQCQVGALSLQDDLDKFVESTPLLKEPQSTCRKGKHPGENTLKKELWTKFEAASSSGPCLNVSKPGETSHKGFLDRLDEVSCDGEF